MNTLSKSILAGALALICASCGDSSESGQSTPIDSTNMSGVAPAQYGEGTPDTRIDTTAAQRDAMIADSLGGGPQQRTLPQNQPQGSGSNTSNTTDRRTTSGSANQGDADKDRKK